MTTITKASRQWASRPSDERFVSLTELHAHTVEARQLSSAKTVASRAIEAQPDPSDELHGIQLVGPNGNPVTPTHWAFGQLAQRAGAPAGYLRDLPAPLAADCINYGLKHTRDVEDLGILLRKPRPASALGAAINPSVSQSDFAQLLAKPVSDRANVPASLMAVTGPNYGRVWNSDICAALVREFGDGVSGQFRVPSEFGQTANFTVTRENTTLYASDRDMFVFLADEEKDIAIPNRRNGQAGRMARGFFVWNSETGAGTLGIATFLFDYVCCNRIVWGARGYEEIKVRHTASAPYRWIEDVAPAIRRYANSSTDSITTAIAAARSARIGDEDEVRNFLAKRFSKSVGSAINAAHKADEGRPIETLWDATVGATAYARSLSYQDARVDIEREAGKILALAS